MNSIIQDKKECYICHTNKNLQIHHIFFGKNRHVSEQPGFKVWLCLNHHTGDEGIHFDKDVDLTLKRLCQKEYEKTHTREDFIRLINRNYLN